MTCKDVDKWPGAEASQVMGTHLPVSTHYMLQQAWQTNGERLSEKEKVGGGNIWGEKTGKRGEQTITSTTPSELFYCSGFLFPSTWSYNPCLGESGSFSVLLFMSVFWFLSVATLLWNCQQISAVSLTVPLLSFLSGYFG